MAIGMSIHIKLLIRMKTMSSPSPMKVHNCNLSTLIASGAYSDMMGLTFRQECKTTITDCLSLQHEMKSLTLVCVGGGFLIAAVPAGTLGRWLPLPAPCCAIPAPFLRPSALISPFFPSPSLSHTTCTEYYQHIARPQFKLLKLLLFTSSPLPLI
jgi:hypothetical protein